jgi:uncharacterized protein YutE (UPF0331/DUF86 family)
MIYVVFTIFDIHVYYQIPLSKVMEQLYKVIKDAKRFANIICNVRGGPIV